MAATAKLPAPTGARGADAAASCWTVPPGAAQMRGFTSASESPASPRCALLSNSTQSRSHVARQDANRKVVFSAERRQRRIRGRRAEALAHTHLLPSCEVPRVPQCWMRVRTRRTAHLFGAHKRPGSPPARVRAGTGSRCGMPRHSQAAPPNGSRPGGPAQRCPPNLDEFSSDAAPQWGDPVDLIGQRT